MKAKKNKKNFTIIAIGLINLILSIVVIHNLSNNVPINIFATSIVDKMYSKNFLFIIPAVVMALCVFQLLYRLNTMDKTVTTGKRIEDAIFSLLTGSLLLVNWTLIYIGYRFTQTTLIKIDIPIIYIATSFLGVLMIAIYSTYPINKMGSFCGLRTKETLADEEIWRVSNRFNAFTGFVAGLVVIGISIYFALFGFNWVYLVLALFACFILMFYVPKLYSQSVSRKKAERVIE